MRRSSLLVSYSFELLEPRVLLCGSPEQAIAAGVPAEMFHDGHISYSDFLTLPPALQAHLDSHLVESALSEHPIDWDQVLGLPLHPEGPSNTPNTPDAQTITDGLPDFFPSLYGGTNSFLIDKTTQPGRTLLRFGTQVNNQGDGPCSLISGRPGVDTIPTGAPITSWVNDDGSQNVIQAVYAWNTSTSRYQLSYYRAAGRFTYHPGHGHFHFDGYAYYRLRYNNGGVPGDYVMRDDGTAAIGEKVGFCLLDYVSGTWTTESGGLNTQLPHYKSVSTQNGQPSTGCGLLQGVTVGHADGYSRDLDGQWIDVTGVPNGSYFVEISLDGNNAVLETNENNNTKTFAYALSTSGTSGGIQADPFDANGSHDDSFATAHDFGELGRFTQTGMTVHWGQDFDYYSFTATSTGSYTVVGTVANNTTDNLDIYLFNAAQTQVAASTAGLPNTGPQVYPVETITYNFVKGQKYYVLAEGYNNSSINNYQIAWNLNPQIASPATDAQAYESRHDTGAFYVSRNGPTSGPITIALNIGGTATRDVDYTIDVTGGNLVGNQLTIGDLSPGAIITINPIQDFKVEPTETVTLQVNSSSLYVSDGLTSTVRIADNGLTAIGKGGVNNSPMVVNDNGDSIAASVLRDDQGDDQDRGDGVIENLSAI